MKLHENDQKKNCDWEYSQPFSKSLLHKVLVEYALLVSQSLGGGGLCPQLRCWSTRTNESRSFWCILWTCIVGRRIVQTDCILLAIGLGGLNIPIFPYGKLYNRVGLDVFGPSEGKHQCIPVWRCIYNLCMLAN